MLDQDLKDVEIAAVSLDYPNLPLAVEFGKKNKTLGFNVNLYWIEGD